MALHVGFFNSKDIFIKRCISALIGCRCSSRWHKSWYDINVVHSHNTLCNVGSTYLTCAKVFFLDGNLVYGLSILYFDRKRHALITQFYTSPLLLNRLIEAQFLTYNENRR